MTESAIFRVRFRFLSAPRRTGGPPRDSDDPRDAIGGAMRAFKLEPIEYDYDEPAGAPYRPEVHKAATLRLRPRLVK